MVVRKLIYISTINLVLKKAQSLQVIKFVKSLHKISLNEEVFFKAFSLSEVPSQYSNYFEVINKRYTRNRLKNNLIMIFYLLKNNLIDSQDFIFSRDLFLVFIFAILGNKTIYEYHHPAPFLNSIVFKLYNLLPNTRLVTISKALKFHFLKNNNWYTKKVLVLHSAVEIEKYENLPTKKECRDELGMFDNYYYILHTGSPYEGRGIEKFVQLCKFSADVFFIHIGGSNSDLKRLRKLAKESNINNCLFLPNIEEEEIIKYQKAADLLFYIITEKWPTFWCCSPLKLPEYMASGTPILASGIGSITEIINKKNSFLYDINDKSLCNSLFKAKSNPTLASKIAISARLKAETNFTLDLRSKLLIKYLKKF